MIIFPGNAVILKSIGETGAQKLSLLGNSKSLGIIGGRNFPTESGLRRVLKESPSLSAALIKTFD
jgi:hypothetical protein